jgi:nicotinamide mononucleotide transporter
MLSHDADMSWTEIAGFLTGAVSVWLYTRQNVWAWPIGIANSVCWLVLFWSSRLYLDAGLQLVYIGLGVAGWYWWLRGGERPGELSVARTRRGEVLALVAAGVVGTLGLWWAMIAVADVLPLPDAATTVVSLIAQYMLTRKLLGNWWCWIAVDAAYIFMYANQGLYLTAALQPVFIGLCIAGLRSWRADVRDATTTADAGAAVVAR